MLRRSQPRGTRAGPQARLLCKPKFEVAQTDGGQEAQLASRTIIAGRVERPAGARGVETTGSGRTRHRPPAPPRRRPHLLAS